jgi:hypothetical protein
MRLSKLERGDDARRRPSGQFLEDIRAGALLAFGPPTATSLELCRSQVLTFLIDTARPVKAVEVRLRHASGFSHGDRLWEVGERHLTEIADEVAQHIAANVNAETTDATVVVRSGF